AWVKFDLSSRKAKNKFITDALGVVEAHLRLSDVARINTDNGYKTVLSPKFAKEIARAPSLSFGKHMDAEFHTNIPAFAPFKQFHPDSIFLEGMLWNRSRMRPQSPFRVIFQKAQWHNIPLKYTMTKIIAQVSSRIILGEGICRDPEWLHITTNYTVDAFRAAEELKLWPKAFRPAVARMSGSYRKVHKGFQAAKNKIGPLLEKRYNEKAKALREGG
ncbi:uncharacterized protein N7482_001515, partial [Penicillium canariense]